MTPFLDQSLAAIQPGDLRSRAGSALKRRVVFPCLPLLAVCCMGVGQSSACDVPVFRYALERWPVDSYRAVVVKTVPFSPAETESLKKLQERSKKQGLNLRLQVIEGAALAKSEYARSLADRLPGNRLFLFYPRSSGLQQVIWQDRLSPKTVDALSLCKVRKALTQLLLSGKSAVFLLLESGNAKVDKAALVLLQKSLSAMNRQIQLPATVATGNMKADDPVNQLKSPVPFKIDFALLTMPPPVPDKGPTVLRHCLLGLEPDLKTLRQSPMVFMIYGRGRVMPPLIGKGINTKMIEQLCLFVSGACSCQVKAQNPGTDLLIQQNWDDAVLPRETE